MTRVRTDRERLAAVTLDYETWQPVPRGRRISWHDDVLDPTGRLLDLCDAEGVPLTIMAEVAEYLWLQVHDPPIASAMAGQWREAIQRGHDVQLHLHLSWLPELGARFDGREWRWRQDYLRADDYEGDLPALLARCKAALEREVREAAPDYQTTCFRAGAYQVQPFRRLHDALVTNGIWCDSSVYAGGTSAERGYDFRLAYSERQPYYANPYDPQLRAPAGESRIVELPIYTYRRGHRWLLDGTEGPLLARRFLESEGRASPDCPGAESDADWRGRLAQLLWGGLASGDRAARRLNRVLPRRLAHALCKRPSRPALDRDYFVLIGHSKGDLRLAEIGSALRELRRSAGLRFVTLSRMAELARDELGRAEKGPGGRNPGKGLWQEVAGRLRAALWARAPWDRDEVLEISSVPLPALTRAAMGWARARGLATCARFDGGSRMAEAVTPAAAGRLANVPYPSGAFDLVCVDQALARTELVDSALAELHRVLREGGVMLAAVPSDARNPSRADEALGWMTAPHEVRLRLEAAGFGAVEIEEVDAYRQIGMPPRPSSADRVIFVRAWKRNRSVSRLDRAAEIMSWVYARLSPEQSHRSNDAAEILRDGFAWCAGYNTVLGRILQREGYEVAWITMVAEDHPRGRGDGKADTHAVLEVLVDGRPHVFDAMTNSQMAHSLEEILARPELARRRSEPDERYRQRGYELYDTSFWYERVVRYCRQAEPDRDPCEWRSVRRRR